MIAVPSAQAENPRRDAASSILITENTGVMRRRTRTSVASILCMPIDTPLIFKRVFGRTLQPHGQALSFQPKLLRRRLAASKPNASLGKARLRIAAPQERQTSKKSPSSAESGETGGRRDRRAEGWRQSLPASEHGRRRRVRFLDKAAGGAPSSSPHIHDRHFGVAGPSTRSFALFCSGQSSE